MLNALLLKTKTKNSKIGSRSLEPGFIKCMVNLNFVIQSSWDGSSCAGHGWAKEHWPATCLESLIPNAILKLLFPKLRLAVFMLPN